MPSDPKPGTLYLVGTPIGNLEDMTFRAVRILQAVDVIAAEDTRHTGKLLQHFQITTPQVSYYEHNQKSRIPDLLRRLQQGQAIALVTDAGMPGISDPGYELVKSCVATGFAVVPIPGASAAIAALVASGLPSDRFLFEGFLPAKSKERLTYLEDLTRATQTLVFYEAPHRLRQTLQDLATVLGRKRAIALARELTKMHEEIWRGTIQEAIDYYAQKDPQGEYTLVVSGAECSQPVFSEEVIRAELQSLLQQGLSRSEASRELAKQTTLPRRQIYQLALSLSVDEELDDG